MLPNPVQAPYPQVRFLRNIAQHTILCLIDPKILNPIWLICNAFTSGVGMLYK
jgi:hypothetical protein